MCTINLAGAFLLIIGLASAARVPMSLTRDLSVRDSEAVIEIPTVDGDTELAQVVSVESIDPFAFLASSGITKRDQINAATAKPDLGPDYANATFNWNPMAFQVTTIPVAESNDTALVKRVGASGGGCSPCSYTTTTFLSFWNGDWDDAWEPQCDTIAWSSAGHCLENAISKSTKYSGSISIGWKQIISAKIGVEVDRTTSHGRHICVSSACGCHRLWTSARMTWHRGTMYTDYWTNGRTCDGRARCAGARKTRTDRQDNIQIDAGKKDQDGLFLITPGGSPCSDGPPRCGHMDWGCRGGGNAWSF